MKHNNYYVRPSVLAVGKRTEVHILPRGENARFDNRFVDLPWGEVAPKQRFPAEWFTPDTGRAVRVRIVPFTHCYSPADTSGCEVQTVHADADGGLTVAVLPEAEGEYQIEILAGDSIYKKLAFSVYAVNGDLFGLRAYKGDLHSHSIYSDGKDALDIIAANYRAAGFDFLALTDHFKRFPSLMMKEITDPHAFGLQVFPGEEVHVPDIRFHYVHVGGDRSVNEHFADHKEQYEAEYREIYDSLDIRSEKLRDFAARLTWIHRENKRAGGLSIYAHPCWRWEAQNMPDEVSDYVFENGLMDAFELMGGQSVGENNIQLAMWQDWAAEGKRYPIVASSDQHISYKEAEPLFNGYYTIVFAKDSSFSSVSEAILEGRSTAAENRELTSRDAFRAYGKMRYVAYTQFLWREFYPQYEVLCKTVGTLMRMFFEGDTDALADALRAQERAEDYAERFFGRR